MRVCAPFETRKRRMMERLDRDDQAQVAEEIRSNDEAHGAIIRRHFAVQWTDSENYDLVLNTQRLTVEECVTEVLALVRSPQFAETAHARLELADMALTAAVRAARPKRALPTSQ